MKNKSIRKAMAVFVETTEKIFAFMAEYRTLSFLVCIIVFLTPPLLGAASIGYYGKDTNVSSIMFFEVMAVLLWLIPFWCFKKIQGKEKKKIRFFWNCHNGGINDLTDHYQKEKAILIAQRIGLTFKNINILYEEAKELANLEHEEWIKAEYKELLDAEVAQKRALTRFVHYIGRNKRVAILEDIQTEYRQKAEKMRDSAYGAVRASQQKEINSGVIGGIASGLLGGVAGIAAYIDTENRNAQIRSINQRNINSMAHGILDVMNTAYEYEREADRLQHLIDDAKIKLVSDIPDDRVFSYLSISPKKVEISKTGTFGIAVEVKVNETQMPLMIGKASGVIDGTIEAEMYQDNKCVGSALMVLPTFGVKDKATIGGIAIASANTSKPYEIKFKPYHLWIMEE